MNLYPQDKLYNRTPVRKAQGEHRARKSNYRATGIRAAHHVQYNPKDNKKD